MERFNVPLDFFDALNDLFLENALSLLSLLQCACTQQLLIAVASGASSCIEILRTEVLYVV